VEPPRAAGSVASYRIWNSDGSPSQQCGNGARCIAAWLVRDGAVEGDTFALDSPVGTHAVTRLADGHYRVVMGVPDFAPAHVPLHGISAQQDEYTLDVAGGTVRFGAVSMGNPHAVIYVDDPDAAPVERWGRVIEHHPAFPNRVNVEFVRVRNRGRIAQRTWERGAGETLACGSGACAVAVVSMLRGVVDRAVQIELRGGVLEISWPADDAHVEMTGPAAEVFTGVIQI
jgi:diaminopimelate epimerase